MRGLRSAGLALWCLTAALLLLAPAANGGSPGPRKPSVALSGSFPTIFRAGQLVSIGGHIRGAPSATRAALQTARSRAWSTVTSVRLGANGTFTLRWRIPAADVGELSLRVAALRDGRVLAHSPAHPNIVGPAPVHCLPPTPPTDVPAGDGWIVGGLYIEGGPFPGLDECESATYTVTETASSSGQTSSEQVAGMHSYTLVLPAGSYTLKAGCSVPAHVVLSAGKQVSANTYCLVP